MNTTAFPLVPRPTYETVLRETMNTPSIKVLTGIRRCGKSTLLKMFANKLLDDGIPSQNLLYMKLDSYDAPLEPTPSWLDSILSTGLKASDSEAPFYVFLDEIQEVEGWEHPIRRLSMKAEEHAYT